MEAPIVHPQRCDPRRRRSRVDDEWRELLADDPITVDSMPELYALYHAPDEDSAAMGEVIAWVLRDPYGDTYLLYLDPDSHTQRCGSLDRVAFWAALSSAELVAVRGRSPAECRS